MNTTNYESEVLSVSAEGVGAAIAQIRVSDIGTDYTLAFDEESRTRILEALETRPLLLRGAIPSERIEAIVSEAKSFVSENSPSDDRERNAWRFVERWVHIRKPQVRNCLYVKDESSGFPETAKAARMLIRLRNQLHAWDSEIGLNPSKGHSAAISFSHYPSGGGFMLEHRDTGDEATVAVLNLSKRGKEFQRGGLFARDEEGEFIDIDAFADSGDIPLMRATLRHGVASVDPEQALDNDWSRGRIMLFAPLAVIENYTVA